MLGIDPVRRSEDSKKITRRRHGASDLTSAHQAYTSGDGLRTREAERWIGLAASYLGNCCNVAELRFIVP
jgi:hypothetical protein